MVASLTTDLSIKTLPIECIFTFRLSQKIQSLFLQVVASDVFWGRLYSNGKGLSPLSCPSAKSAHISATLTGRISVKLSVADFFINPKSKFV